MIGNPVRMAPMMKTAGLLLLALSLLPGASPQDKKGPKNKEVQKQFHDLMESNGRENKAIQKDLEEKKGDAAIKERLATIRKNAEAASKLDYLAGSEEDVARFKRMFEIFLDTRMKSFQKEIWDEAGGEKLYERLQGACRTCHELFRD